MGLRSEKKNRRRLAASFQLAYESRGASIHVGSSGKIDPGLQTKFFVECRFDFRKSLATAESLRSRDKNNLVAFLFRTFDDSVVLLCSEKDSHSRYEKEGDENAPEASKCVVVHRLPDARVVFTVNAMFAGNEPDDCILFRITNHPDGVFTSLHRIDALFVKAPQ